MRGTSSSYIELPASIQKKHARVNVQNSEDDQCFKWAVLSALHPTERNRGRLLNYQKHKNKLNSEGIAFPECTKIRTSK